MNRREFVSALTKAAVAAGFGELSYVGQIKARSIDLIRVSYEVTSQAAVFMDMESLLKRKRAEAELQAKRLNWFRWKTRVIDTTLPDRDALGFQVVLERIA